MTMKTSYTSEDVRQFLQTTEHANPDSIEQIAEGHISQALGFETNDGSKLVLRIAPHQNDFLADQYAGNVFGQALLVPKVTEIGNFGENSYYCISERVEGVPSNKLSAEEIYAMLPEIHEVFARIFQTDISATNGYGEIDTDTGNAGSDSWKASLVGAIEAKGIESLRKSTQAVGLDPTLADKFLAQFYNNLTYASEVRRLFHGDLGFDNMLVQDGKVTAIIDWAQMGYGDWMRDYARLDFWRQGRYGSAEDFAKQYDLDSENIPERIALYHAVNALLAIDFADRHKNASVTEWLQENVASKVIPNKG